MWTWIQDDESTESSGDEEDESLDEDEEEEASEEEVEGEEAGDDGSGIKEEEEEPFLAQWAPRSTHVEVARMAAQPKGTPAKPKPEKQPKSSKAQDPEELSLRKEEKAHRKSPTKKKSKGNGKKKVEEKPKRVHYTLEGEPHKKMPTGATRGEKYQARPAYDNDMQVMHRTLEGEYDGSLGRVCQHYKVCLAEDAQGRHKLGLALRMVTHVRASNVQMIGLCGTKNTAAARELFDERYHSSTPRQAATGLIKGLSVCTNSVGALDRPADFGDPSVGGLPFAKMKGEPPAA